MSGTPVPPAKLSVRERLRQRLKPGSRASSPTPAPVSTQASTQILASSGPPSARPPATNSPNASAVPSSSQQAAPNPSGHNVLDVALKRLSDNDRETPRKHIPPTSSDIDLALEQAVAAAKEKQRCCLENSWRIRLAGKEFILKKKADKIVRWLIRFKEVGDVAAAADPVHAGWHCGFHMSIGVVVRRSTVIQLPLV
ncbi:uncharacterized protein Z518_00076 [Rhinocladiella mackenziei CBS 650.93]|uniref:Uncharacterized protein n=1 Tax=Rhinocladiella mackenziei CBS 650.93 TaxID=1442369 RepID=A0A0D2HEJ3_9EURO|nr:uncharacterized protein Z518_00076 [Rhinocladiella mackenziei CBS 650.93]KIX08998.1 hypothetical protein Z518_00076 [Rhinocladiella mackenziei CBS 650.93]